MIFCKMTLEKMISWQNDLCKAKWPVDKMANWQNDQLTKWPVDKMSFGKMTSWWNDFRQNDQLTKWLFQNTQLTKWLVAKWLMKKMNSWQNDQLIKWPVDKMTFGKMTWHPKGSNLWNVFSFSFWCEMTFLTLKFFSGRESSFWHHGPIL